MSEDIVQRSSLALIADAEPPYQHFKGVEIRELAFMSHFNLRLPGDEANQFEQFFEFKLPLEPNTFALSGPDLCIWLGPDEWLLICGPDRSETVRAKVLELARSGFAAAVNLSSAQTIIRVTGHRAADFLSRAIAYDLHPRNFTAGHAVQTVLARVPVVIVNQAGEEMTFDVIVRRSFADYLWHWLVDAGSESAFRP